ncbi:MAG TPA: primosomal protein N' [Candidatus Paceibacterota bacterium]|nr:primosomal protein N' [Candidatus Paceibacterota bacterium]
MYIIEVIPLTILPPNVPQILSYFSDSELPKGAVVEISLNKRKVNAVVISSSSLEKEKLSLKKVDFQIKKLTKVLYEDPQVSDYQLKLAVWLARYYYSPLGYTLKTILPSFAFKKKYPLTVGEKVIHNFPLTTRSVVNPQLLIYKTKGLAERLRTIVNKFLQSQQKATSAAGRQVLIMVPEKTAINYFVTNLPEKFQTSVVFSGLSNEKLYDAWQKARSGETDIVIGTRQALNMPFKDLGLLIVDDPLHEFYKSDMVPRYNAVTLAHKVAELNNARLVLTSVIPGIENHYKAKNGVYELKHIESRPKFDAEIVDMAQEVKNANWSPISKKLNEELLAYLRENKRVLIFSPRRGYAGILICGNCGSAVKCPQCEVAMRTHRSVEMLLVCHHCALSKPMPKNCSVCGNHNLKTVGPAGTQKIYDYVKARLAAADIKATVLALDTDIVKNETEEDEIISEISNPPAGGGSVLIATQMVFSHRFYLNFDLIAIINSDALTNIPDFKSEENLFCQMEKFVNFEPKKLLIQTYNPENELIEKAVAGDYIDFYDNELKLREVLNYPPFFKLIKLTFRHTNRNKASYAARVTTEKLKMAVARMRLGNEIKIIEATPAYIEKERGLYFYNIFLKVQEGYQDINDLLKYAGPGWLIDVEPRSLL